MTRHVEDRDNLSNAARGAVGRTVRAGAILYRRETHLPRLIRLFSAELPRTEPEATRFILARLAVEARRERRRGRTTHWSYDLNRHIALMQALAAERLHLLGAKPRARSSHPPH